MGFIGHTIRVSECMASRVVLALPVVVCVVIAMFIALALGPAPEQIGRFMGHMNPVVRYQSLTVTKQGVGYSDVEIEFDKLRQCKFISLSFYFVEPDGALVRIPWKDTIKRDGAMSRSRPIGSNRIQLTFYTTAPIDTWVAEVTHSCGYVGPWTITQVWPP